MPSVEDFFAHCDALTSGKSPLRILEDAQLLLSDEERWSRYVRALNSDGQEVPIEDPDAVRWDLEGAIAYSSNDFGIIPPYFMRLLDEAVVIIFGEDIGVNWISSKRNYEYTLEILTIAIRLEKERMG